MTARRASLVVWATRLLCLAAAGLLLYTGFAKLMDRAAFAEALRSQELLGEGAIRLVSNTLPVAEVVVAGLGLALLVRRKTVPAAAIIMCLLFGVFAAYLSVLAVNPPSSARCGCGMSNKIVTDWFPYVIRSVLWSGSLAAGALLSQRAFHPTGSGPDPEGGAC